MADDDGDIGFEEQLEQENRAKVEEQEKEAATHGLTYTDTDGTVMEWDRDKRAYFPKIDSDFIAKYQMNYGAEFNTAAPDQAPPGSDNTAPGGGNSNAQAWYDYYNQQSAYKSSDNADRGTDGQDNKEYTAADYHAYYSYYYGEDYMKYMNHEEDGEDHKETEDNEDDDAKDKGDGKKRKKKGKDKGDLKRKAPPQPEPAWFDIDTEKSTHVYVSNLPVDMTEEDFRELMTKCGLVMFDPLTNKPKLKLYRNADGTLKGDGLCCYIKQESVDLAMKILDGSDIRGNTISIERAKFTLKGSFDPSKKKKKLGNKAKRRMKEKQAKLFDWRPDMAPGTRLRFERIVILKNMFDPNEFENEPTLINELREDVRAECTKFGEVRKVQVHDRHPEGVISVIFKTPEEADVCVAALQGRWFAKKQISAETYDGKTRYEVHETEAEKQERLRGWEKFLGDEAGSSGAGDKDTHSQREKSDSCGSNRLPDVVNAHSSAAAAGASSAVSDSGGDLSRRPSEGVGNEPGSSVGSSGAADAIVSEESSEQ